MFRRLIVIWNVATAIWATDRWWFSWGAVRVQLERALNMFMDEGAVLMCRFMVVKNDFKG